MLLDMYALLNTSVAYRSETATVAVLVGLLVLHVAAGWLANRWWALLLPLAAVVLSIPAGDPAEGWEPYPIWFGVAVAAPAGMVLILAGIAARRIARPQAAA